MANRPPLVVRLLARLARRRLETPDELPMVIELQAQREASEVAHAADVRRRKRREATGHLVEDVIYPPDGGGDGGAR